MHHYMAVPLMSSAVANYGMIAQLMLQ